MSKERNINEIHATAQEVSDFAFGSDAAASLGLRDDALKAQIRRLV